MGDIIFICPHCKAKSDTPNQDGWKEIEVGCPMCFGIKFCPDCYELYKDKDLQWSDFKDGKLIMPT